MKRTRIGVCTFLGALVFPIALCAGSASAVSPNIVISQIYTGGQSNNATFKTDYIELYNRGATAVTMTNWTVQYQAAGPTGTIAVSARTVINGTIPPGKYFLISGASGSYGSDIPPVDASGSLGLQVNSAKVFLVNGTGQVTTAAGTGGNPPTVTVASGSTLVDYVGYGTANIGEGNTRAPVLSATTAATRNLGGRTDTDNNAADFTESTPRPRNSSSPMTTPFWATTSAVKSSPTAYNGNVYFGNNTGRLYGYNVNTGAALAGFPIDTRTMQNNLTGKLESRLALKVVADGLRLFGTSNLGVVFSVPLTPDGARDMSRTLWNEPLPQILNWTNVNTKVPTPAVVYADDIELGPRDYVFVAVDNRLQNAEDGTDARLVKMDALTGQTIRTSAPLGTLALSAPAAYFAADVANSVFVTVNRSTALADVVRVQATDLTVLNSIGMVTQNIIGSPFIYTRASQGATVYVATAMGNVYAASAFTGSPDNNFSGDGKAELDPSVELGSPFAYNNTLYVGSNTGKVFAVNPTTGSATTVFTASSGIADGLGVDPAHGATPASLVFGTVAGDVYQVPLDNPSNARVTSLGASTVINTTPTIDQNIPALPNGSNTVMLGGDTGNVYRLPRL